MSLPRIAVDAMGGDEGVRVMVEGAALARRRHERFKFLLVGDEARIKTALEKHPNLRASSEILHADGVISGEEKPGQALRRAKGTSMGRAIEAVKNGDAGAAVSGGNTGALMAIAKLSLRTMPGIDRPALAALLPTLGDNDVVMLDLGANTECNSRNLVQFAVMGSAYARVATGRERPRLRLLNIGTEEIKGHEEIREAGEMLRAMNLPQFEYVGFVEGDGIGKGAADVIVTEGFSGNIALKAAEGTARQISDFLRTEISKSLMAKIGYLFARGAFRALRNKLDPKKSNGGVLLGLRGVVVKSHGGTDAEGFAYAIDVGYEMVRYDLLTKINEMLNRDGGALSSVPTSQEAVS